MPTTTSEVRVRRTKPQALLVATGILCSRLAGLIRQRVIAHYFGLTTDAADAWAAGFRIPNLLQNLFGEGALSASFIPVYASLLGRDRREADRVAGAIGAILALVVSVLVVAGVLMTPWLVDVIAPGFNGAKRELTVRVVRILFPGAGFLVLSAWCLGILNSHRRFLLSYAAPVIWSAAMIVALLWFGGRTELPQLVSILAWGSVVGSVLQFAVQIPVVLRVAPHLVVGWSLKSSDVRSVIRNFVPAFVSRGVVQVSAFVDTLLASLLPTGAVAGLTNAQILYTLPVSLFGISVSAAALPAMSRTAGEGSTGYEQLRRQMDEGLRRIAFFVVPSAMLFLALGDVVAAALLQTGRFGVEDAVYVWAILAGSSVGLLASTLGRLYASAHFARRDTRTPLRYALLRVTLGTAFGYVCAIHVPRWTGVDPSWGAAGLTAASGVAGWIEMLLLRSALNDRVGRTGLAPSYVIKLWSAAAFAAAVAWMIKLGLPAWHPVVAAVVIIGPFAVVYLAVTFFLGVSGLSALSGRRGQESSS